jgi:hypothetical protein
VTHRRAPLQAHALCPRRCHSRGPPAEIGAGILSESSGGWLTMRAEPQGRPAQRRHVRSEGPRLVCAPAVPARGGDSGLWLRGARPRCDFCPGARRKPRSDPRKEQATMTRNRPFLINRSQSGPIHHPPVCHPLPRCAGYRTAPAPPLSRWDEEGLGHFSRLRGSPPGDPTRRRLFPLWSLNGSVFIPGPEVRVVPVPLLKFVLVQDHWCSLVRKWHKSCRHFLRGHAAIVYFIRDVERQRNVVARRCRCNSDSVE